MFTNQVSILKISAWGMVLFLLGVIPASGLQAQNYEAVQKRLVNAVNNDELSIEQAAIMLQALREYTFEMEMEERERHAMREEWDQREREHGEHHDHGDHDHNGHEHNDHEHGDEHHDGDQHESDRHKEEDEDRRMRAFKRQAELLERAVGNGRISKADATRRLTEMKKELWAKELWAKDRASDDAKNDKVEELKRERFAEFERELIEKVKRGDITEEVAEEEMMKVKERLWGQDRNEQRERRQKYRDAEIKIKAMVEAGKVSEKDGRQRLKALGRSLWPDRFQDRDRDQDKQR